MKNLRKILISSIILIVIGIIGLAVTLPMVDWGTTQNVNLSFGEVKNLAGKYLEENNLSNLEISEIMEFSQNFYIEILEKDTGIGAMELLVDKSSGAIFPEYGPNMMWNLKYGMHSRMSLSRSSTNMPIEEDEALDIAGKYLAKLNTGESAGSDIVKFYGYYTIHTEAENGEVSGMLSINGFTGQVWYHNWHGAFIDMIEINVME